MICRRTGYHDIVCGSIFTRDST